MSSANEITKLPENCIKLIHQVVKLIKIKDHYSKLKIYLNKTIALLRKYMKSNVNLYDINREHFMKLESNLALFKKCK